MPMPASTILVIASPLLFNCLWCFISLILTMRFRMNAIIEPTPNNKLMTIPAMPSSLDDWICVRRIKPTIAPRAKMAMFLAGTYAYAVCCGITGACCAAGGGCATPQLGQNGVAGGTSVPHCGHRMTCNPLSIEITAYSVIACLHPRRRNSCLHYAPWLEIIAVVAGR